MELRPPADAPRSGIRPCLCPSWERFVRAGLLCVLCEFLVLDTSSAPRLRLLPPQFEGGGQVGLIVSSDDEGALTSDRVSGIEVFATRDVASHPSDWQALPGPRFLTNGVLRVTHPVEGSAPGIFFVALESSTPPAVTVRDASGLRAAVNAARPGTRILMEPGLYPGGFNFANLRGETNRTIVIAAADPADPPRIQGGANGMQFTDPAFVELHDLVFTGATGNGLNIDDGGSFNTPARQVVLRRLRISDVGPDGNRDGIKLSGVVGFRVEGCTVERWGTGGSAIDMVGCHDGLIVSNLFRHTEATAASAGNGVQAKGGSRDVIVRRNRFEHAGSRGVNIGGSTGLQFFRPPLETTGEHWEAKDIRVEGNTFIGSAASVAFVGVDGAEVRFNTIYRPQRWVLRILQENTAAGFVASRNGRFTDNIVAFHSTQWSAGGVNVGGGTAPGTFQFARNWWYCVDAPNQSRPSLPVTEANGVQGVSPQFQDAAGGDLRLQPGSPAGQVGADALPE